MLSAFGWKEPHPDRELVKPRWAEAQAATERAVSPAFAAIPEADREEFVTLVNQLQVAVTA
jgi:hypothetical protein